MRISLAFLSLTLSAGLMAQGTTTTGTVITSLAANNYGSVGGGVYFNMEPGAAGIEITGLEVCVQTAAGTAGAIEIWTTPGDAWSNVFSTANWTLIDTAPLTSAGAAYGNGTLSTMALTQHIALNVGKTGFAMVGVGHNLVYSNAGGLLTVGNQDLFVECGAAQNQAFTFTTVFASRVVNMRATYELPPGYAYITKSGTGCVTRFGGYMEVFADEAAFDLNPVNPANDVSMAHVPAGSGYLVQPPVEGNAYLAPSGSAIQLTGVGDESFENFAFAGTFDYPGGSTNSLDVGSNGGVAIGGNGMLYYYSTAPNYLKAYATGPNYMVHLRDYICGGNVWAEEIGGVVYITWLDVDCYSGTGTAGTTSTFQAQFDTNTDIVTYVWKDVDNVSLAGWGYPNVLVGFTPGDDPLLPASVDLNGGGTPLVCNGHDVRPLGISSNTRPIANSVANITTDTIPALTPFAAVQVGLSNPNFDLGVIGMPGCTQYTSQDVNLLFLPGGADTFSINWNVPGAALTGLTLTLQSVAYCPSYGYTATGAIASDALEYTIGTF